MKRASYREAIRWIAGNDDNEWLDDETDELIPSVAAALVVDLFDVSTERVAKDIGREVKKLKGGGVV